ncbi:hypothetical protein [Sulfurimonas sp.]|uniref:hypothetical protein n=1 Tax=Sulfurimonas sp. TaxID=2022749 RepID=UPI00356344DA
MKKIFNVIFLVFIFIASFIIFFPKEKLYYYAQEKLLVYNIMIESKSIKSQPFSLDVQQSYILLSGSRVASIKHFNISLFGMNFEGVEGIGAFKSTVPASKQINIFYKPGTFAKVNGDFGEIIGTLDIGEKKIIFEAKIQQAVKNKYSMLFAKFKKVGDIYVYEITL